MPRTHCQGFIMNFTRPIDRQQYAQMILDIEQRLNDDHDPKERRYHVLPEKITEGAFHVVSYPKHDGITCSTIDFERVAEYKSMRHWIHDEPFHQMTPYPWPWIMTSIDEHHQDWLMNGSGIPFIPKHATSQTLLKALNGAPVWTVGELTSIASVLQEGYGILCTKFPKPHHLTMEHGPVKLLT